MKSCLRSLVLLGVLIGSAPAGVEAQSPVAMASLSSAVCPGSGCVILGTGGLGSASVQVTGTWVGTLTFEVSLDGVNYVTVSALPTNSTTTVTTTTGNGIWTITAAGLGQFRVRFSAYTSGTAVVSIMAVSAKAGPGATGGGGGGGSGTVTSVDMSVPTGFTISGNPITTSGTLAVALSTETANTVWAGPTSGGATAPVFRALVSGDLPSGTGTVTSVGWTGGLVSIATATTTPAFTVAGTSGGIPYFSGAATWASSGALNSLVLGNGAGMAPTNYAGSTCTNQAVTALSSVGAATCTTLTSAYVNNSIALTGTDINTSNQVTATHLAAALPVAQGGTGLTALGTGVATFLGTPSSANLLSAMTTSTGSGNLVFATSPTFVTPAITTSSTTSNNGIGGTSTDGSVIQNTTAAANNAQQWSPRLHFIGQGWKTNTTAASQTADWIIENQTVQGTGNPATNLVLSYQVNGGGYTAAATFGQAGGTATFGGTVTTNGSFIGNQTGSVLQLGGKATKYSNVNTVGWGLPAIYGQGRSTAQTAAVASVASYTVGSADGSFEVSANVNVTASTTNSFTVTVAYTDETNASQTLTLTFSSTTGTLLTAITNVLGTGAYEGVPFHIRCKASTTITIATTGTFTSVTYNVEGIIKQMA